MDRRFLIPTWLKKLAGTIQAIAARVELSILRIFPIQDKRRQVLTLLRSVQGPVQAEPGCVFCRICEEEKPEKAIVYLECWHSQEKFERHVRSGLYRHILEALELSHTQPDIQFHQVSHSRGIEVIEALRATREQESETLQGFLERRN